MQIGVILIGGSIKGLYGHAGVIKALDELKIKPTAVLGASAGSVVGSLYVTGFSPNRIYETILDLKPSDYLDPIHYLQILIEFVVKKGHHFTGLVSGDKLEKFVRDELKGKDDFSKTDMPFYVAATNLNTCKIKLFKDGKISEKVRASTSIPMLFKPKKIHGEYYADGAFSLDKLPDELLKRYPYLDLLIISNFSRESFDTSNDYLENSKLPIMEIMRRMMKCAEHKFLEEMVSDTKIIQINPYIPDKLDIFHTDSKKAEHVYNEAYKIAKYQLKRDFKKHGFSCNE